MNINRFLLSRSEMDVWLLSDRISQFCLSFRSWTDGQTFSFRMFRQRAEFTFPYIMASRPGPEEATHPHATTLPPPRLTFGIMFLLQNIVLDLHQMEPDQCLPESSTEHYPRRLKALQSVFFFFGKSKTCVYVPLDYQVVFSWQRSHAQHCALSILMLES